MGDYTLDPSLEIPVQTEVHPQFASHYRDSDRNFP